MRPSTRARAWWWGIIRTSPSPGSGTGSGVIFYSLGNLVFDQFQRIETQHGALAEVVFSGRTLESAALLPVDIVETVPKLAAASGGSVIWRDPSSASR